jgi:HEAT repeat protein
MRVLTVAGFQARTWVPFLPMGDRRVMMAKRTFFLVLTLAWLAPPAQAYIDVSPTLGGLILDSTNIVVLRVEQVLPQKRVIIYRKVADLMRSDPQELVRHQLTDGYHPREPATILEWAEPGRLAVAFHNGKVVQTCIGRYWYEASARTSAWWVMTCGQSQLCFAYSGSVARLREHVRAILDGREVTITAVRYGANDDYRNACRRLVASRGLPRGSAFPVCRLKASLCMPASLYHLAQNSRFVPQPGAGGREDVPALLAALKAPDWSSRSEALEDLGLIGTEAKAAAPTVRAALRDPDARVRVRAAAALVRIVPDEAEARAVLARLLKDKDGRTRRAAAEALRDIGGAAVRDAIPALAKALADTDLKVRWAAAEALEQGGPEAATAVPALTRAVQDADALTRAAAVGALGAVGPRARAATAALVRALDDKDETLRWAAADALVRIDRQQARAAVPLLVEGLRGSDSRLRWHALAHLGKLDAAAQRAVPLELLSRALRDPDIGVRGRAALILGDLGPRASQAAPDLAEALKDVDEWVHTVAAVALVRVVGRHAAAALPVLAEGLADADADTSESCARALRELGPAAKGAAPALTRALQSPNQQLGLLAAEGLVRAGADAQAVLPVALRGLKSPSPDLRARAARLLGRLGPEAAAAVPSLLALLEDEDPNVGRTAGQALRSIDPEAAARVTGPAAGDSLGWRLAVWACLAALIGLSAVAARWLAREEKAAIIQSRPLSGTT